MVELDETIKTLIEVFESQKSVIKQQENRINSLSNDLKRSEQDKAVMKGQIMELEAKWSKIQSLLKGVKG